MIVYLKTVIEQRSRMPSKRSKTSWDPDTWEPASEIFCRIGARAKAAGASQH